MRKFLTIFVVFILSFGCFGAFDENIEKMIIKEFERKYKNDNFFVFNLLIMLKMKTEI